MGGFDFMSSVSSDQFTSIQAWYIVYAVFDAIFGCITLYRFIWTFVVWVYLRKQSKRIILRDSDDTSPLLSDSTRENKGRGFDAAPKLAFFGLSAVTCFSL